MSMKDYQDGFISYGRADSKAFAGYLHDRLVEQGFEIWFDQNDIPLAVDFQTQIDTGIGKSHNFLFIIAPHSVNSPYCAKEIERALQYNKRIIPLLHVEQIPQEVWQKRNPDQSLEAWEVYQQKGLHNCFQNMHPAISRINWVYFREGIDDFETSFQGLLEIFERHRDYVQKHTYFLNKALDWERNQYQTRYLLIGEERAEAETWLRVRFENEQPPCEPTDLHCEFICESAKNAANLMTDVFLSFAEEDRPFLQKIVHQLQREAFTLWRGRSDVQSGDEYGEQIQQGIEEATTVIYVISPASVRSLICRSELAYACSLKKRIIPIQLAEVPSEEWPDEVKKLRPIQLEASQSEEEYKVNLARLIRALREDANYFEQRKILLSKALKWQRQKRNPSILLRGHNLQLAQSWLDSTHLHLQHGPISIQQEFIAESAKLPPDAALDIFVCYSRTDSDFARKLNDGLQIQGKTTWFDQELINRGDSEAEKDKELSIEMQQGIEQCNNFLFILSPSSIISTSRCLAQLEYAQKYGKRLVPLLLRDLGTADVPTSIINLPWVDFRKHGGDFFTNFGELTRTLDSDPEYLRSHTRLMIKALEWDREERDDAFLLRGKDLETATSWLQDSGAKEPAPTELQRAYIYQSSELPKRTLSPITAALTSLAAGVAVCLVRWAGVLQGAELANYDQMLRSRPSEPPDSRITIVAVDELSIQLMNDRYEPGRGTMPDSALDDTLRLLNQHKPSVIVLDFIRDYAAKPDLARRIKQTPNFVGVCQLGVSDGDTVKGSLSPMPELLPEQVGFAAIQSDTGDYVRRHSLIQAGDGKNCNVYESVSLVVARRYLESQGETYHSPLDENSGLTKVMGFGDIEVPSLWDGTAYSQQQVSGGYQAMLNYRAPKGDASQFASVLSLKDVLNNQFDPKLVRDRILLIGYTATTSTNADQFQSPYGRLPGVILHGQMVSQLVSASLDGRPIIWWLPYWGETLWVFAWTALGGLIGWRSPHLPTLLAALGGSALLLYTLSTLLFNITGGWLPVVPAALALMLASFGVGFLTYRLRH